MLLGVLGDLGSGKTLLLVYYGLKTYHLHKGQRKIFANFHLKKLPYEYEPDLTGVLDYLKEGLLLADELWLYADSRRSASRKNAFVTKVLAKSRKRDLDIFYTCQYWKSIDIRLRTFTDICAFPELNEETNICKVHLGKSYGGGNVDFFHTFKFYAKPIYKLYDTTEEIVIPEDTKEKK